MPGVARRIAWLSVTNTNTAMGDLLRPVRIIAGERRGLVEVRPGRHDRRSRVMTLTGAGEALLAQAVPIWEQAHAEVEGMLAAGEADRLRAALDRLAGPRVGPANP